MRLHRTQISGRTHFEGSYVDIAHNKDTLRLLHLMKKQTSTRDPEIITHMCLAFMFAMDGLGFFKFPAEARCWWKSPKGEEYVLDVEGLKGDEEEEESEGANTTTLENLSTKQKINVKGSKQSQDVEVVIDVPNYKLLRHHATDKPTIGDYDDDDDDDYVDDDNDDDDDDDNNDKEDEDDEDDEESNSNDSHNDNNDWTSQQDEFIRTGIANGVEFKHLIKGFNKKFGTFRQCKELELRFLTISETRRNRKSIPSSSRFASRKFITTPATMHSNNIPISPELVQSLSCRHKPTKRLRDTSPDRQTPIKDSDDDIFAEDSVPLQSSRSIKKVRFTDIPSHGRIHSRRKLVVEEEESDGENQQHEPRSRKLSDESQRRSMEGKIDGVWQKNGFLDEMDDKSPEEVSSNRQQHQQEPRKAWKSARQIIDAFLGHRN